MTVGGENLQRLQPRQGGRLKSWPGLACLPARLPAWLSAPALSAAVALAVRSIKFREG